MKKNRELADLLMNEINQYLTSRTNNQHELCIKYLGRAHIVSQHRWYYHLYVHILMFGYAWKRNDFSEIRSQLLRLIVTIPGHLIGKVPIGNIGWGTVGLMDRGPVPEDLLSVD